MEEGERDEGATEPHPSPSPSNIHNLQISGFADTFVAAILKESIQESGVEPIWSITCSSDCHNHTKAIPGVEGEKSSHGMQLCWTPESPVAPSSPSQAPVKSHCRHHIEKAEIIPAGSASATRTEESPTRCSSSKSDIICQNARNCDLTSELAGKSIQSSLKVIHNEEELYAMNEDANKSSESVANRLTVADSRPTSGEDSATLASAKEYLQELGSGRRFSKEQMAFSDPSEIIAQSAEHLAVDHFHTEENGGTACSLRKGMSVNDVTSGSALEVICSKDLTQPQFVVTPDLSPKNTKRVGFLRQLGRGLRRTREEGGVVEAGRGKKGIRSFRKTLSSLFSLKGRWREEEQEEGRGKRPTSAPVVGLFKLPARKGKTVPPSKRALPPVPAVDSLTEAEPPPGTPDPTAPVLDESVEIREMEEGDWPMASEHSPDQGNRDGEATNQMKFAASIEKVKDQGWYWGPISGEAAEKILAKEPDGSFVVRDSSDHHYIFSLTFKLNGFVRHVRIEHDQGNFSFGSFTKFKSNTIVDFIENAVEHSRSGRYLFFLHRRPVLGPMRVQLLHPVSRFKEVQSLQHMCRYVIVKHVRRDLLNQLPVPTRMKQYLNTPFYYSEQVAEEAEENPAIHAVDQHDPFLQVSDESNLVDHEESEETRENASLLDNLDNERLFGGAESAAIDSSVSPTTVTTVPNSDIKQTLETGDFYINSSASAQDKGQITLRSSSSTTPPLVGIDTSQDHSLSSGLAGGTSESKQSGGNQAVFSVVQPNYTISQITRTSENERDGARTGPPGIEEESSERTSKMDKDHN